MMEIPGTLGEGSVNVSTEQRQEKITSVGSYHLIAGISQHRWSSNYFEEQWEISADSLQC